MKMKKEQKKKKKRKSCQESLPFNCSRWQKGEGGKHRDKDRERIRHIEL